MKTKNCCFFLFFLISISSFGQTDMQKFHIRPNSGITSIDLRSRDIEGTSYINDSFLPATFSNSEHIYLLRYNAYQDEMEFKKDTKLYYLTKSSNYPITFTDFNKVYQVYTFEEDHKQKDGFFVVLNIGNGISLLLKERIKFFEEVKPQSGYDKYQPPTLKRIDDKLYISYKNNTAIELPRKKKEILNLFSFKSKDINVYAKTNKLNFKNTEDLVEIFNYYNSLK